MKHYKRVSLTISIILLAISLYISGNTSVYGSSESNMAYKFTSISNLSIPIDALETAKSNVNKFATCIYQSENEETSINTSDDFSLGAGFYIYRTNGEEVQRTDTIMFPVYQRDQVVFMIKVFPTAEKGKWDATGGTGYAEEYENILKTDGSFIALVDTKERRMKFEPTQSNSNYPYSNGLISDTKISSVVPNEIKVIIQSGIHKSVNGIGFSTDEPNHKEIRMDWCLVLQNDRNGNLVGLCWAASAATIIRQQTGNKTIEAADIADEMGIGYNAGGSIIDARTAMINHGCTTQYQAISRQAVNFYEVENCINNQYPIYMNCGSQNNPDEGHAVTMTGYNLNTSSLQYYDSAMNEFEWAGFVDGSTATIYSLGEYYSWNVSVMIPIY